MDDNSASITRDCDPTNYYGAFKGNIILISLVMVLVAICIIVAFFFQSYARWVQQQCQNCEIHLDESHRGMIFNYGHTSVDDKNNSDKKGLERSILKSLPTFLYESSVHDPLLECTICLSKFIDNELGRVLPKCNHCFHIYCIDMWFYSHSCCPLCRLPINNKPIQKPVKMVSSSSRLCPMHPRDEDQVSSSTFPPPPSGDQKKPPQLVSVLVEIPMTDSSPVDLKVLDPGSDSTKQSEDPGGRVGLQRS